MEREEIEGRVRGAFAGGAGGGGGGDGAGEGEEVEEPDEYDVDGVLGDAVWGPDESDDDDDLRKMHMFRV